MANATSYFTPSTKRHILFHAKCQKPHIISNDAALLVKSHTFFQAVSC
ncbi:hypothetical protein HMPREF9069_00706 [Atopobium sp. oral taxon 810 str. F0209]|nr:hypothetical protein HMPREF9069_00706 [Atopobium sp. oral taxon 810 str. F0209]